MQWLCQYFWCRLVHIFSCERCHNYSESSGKSNEEHGKTSIYHARSKEIWAWILYWPSSANTFEETCKAPRLSLHISLCYPVFTLYIKFCYEEWCKNKLILGQFCRFCNWQSSIIDFQVTLTMSCKSCVVVLIIMHLNLQNLSMNLVRNLLWECDRWQNVSLLFTWGLFVIAY